MPALSVAGVIYPKYEAEARKIAQQRNVKLKSNPGMVCADCLCVSLEGTEEAIQSVFQEWERQHVGFHGHSGW
jgi:hypothetical protein